MGNADIEPRCLDTKQAAAYLGLSTKTFRRLELNGELPRPILIAKRKKLWDKQELDSLIDGLKGF
jgi:predicted DNA-binding transcriptional regulator AlpA|tara:strand:- start:443 stop:637 length:195 start_codon:yes stop_codon:yes gene_type:complete